MARRVDLYLDTLYSAFEMIASGITTVQHLHGWVTGLRLRNISSFRPTHECLRGRLIHREEKLDADFFEGHVARRPERGDGRKEAKGGFVAPEVDR